MENVVVLSSCGPLEARDALRKLRRLHTAQEIELTAAAVLGRRDDGRSFALEQATDDSAVAARGAVGQLLTGPFGLVLQHAPDALVGSLVDVADSRRSDQLLRCFGDALPPGSVVTVALVTETEPDAVDELASRLGATVTRWSRVDVECAIAEVSSAETTERRRGVRDWVRRLRDAASRNSPPTSG